MKSKIKARQQHAKTLDPQEGFKFKTSFLYLILLLYSFLIYGNTLFNDYAQDDAIVITENMFTRQGIKGIPGLLKHDTFYGFFQKEGKDKLVSGGRYRPLSPVSFAVEYEFFGLNPMVSHLINVLLYGLLGMVLFKFLLILFRDTFSENVVTVIAFFSSLIFLSHPLHTEVVANIKGRDEIFTLLFGISALIFSLKWIIERKNIFQVFAFLMMLLALFSKENAITLIAVIPLAAWLFFRKARFSYAVLLMPYLVAAVIFIVTRTTVLGWDLGNTGLELMNNPFIRFDGSKWIELTFIERYSTIIYTLGKYLLLLVFPHPLTNDYYPRHIPIMNISDWQVLLSFVMNILLLITAMKMLNKNRIIAFAILFYFITLSIVSNMVFPVGTNMSERFLFMPSVGFSMAIGYILYLLLKKNRTVALMVTGVIIVFFSIKTLARNQVWKNDFTLFTTDVKVSQNSAKALNAAGGSLIDASIGEENPVKKNIMLNEAKSYLERALDIHPHYLNAMLLLGNADYFLENYEQALETYNKLLEMKPGHEDAMKNIPLFYREAGRYYGEKMNDLPKSLEYLAESYRLNPGDYETVRLSGIANAITGNFSEALFFFEKSIEMDPGNAGAYLNLGNLYYNNGNPEKGRFFHDKAIELDPDIFTK